MTRLHATVSLQVTGSDGSEVLTGLIIRRSWVRSPLAPQLEISFWPAFILSYLNAYIEHIALPPDAIANEIIRCSGCQVSLLPQLPRQGGPQECRKAADLATLRDSGATHLAVVHVMLGGSLNPCGSAA
jgi:hypothetical protein